MTKIAAKIVSKIITVLAKTAFLPVALPIFLYQYYRGVPPEPNRLAPPDPKETAPSQVNNISLLKKVTVHKGFKNQWH
jgi:hypothetical protein